MDKTLPYAMHNQHVYENPTVDINLCLWSLQITITLTEGALLIILQPGLEKLLEWLGIETSTIDRP